MTVTRRPGTVLYVEDEEFDVLFMQRAFQQAGLGDALQAVGDGREALDYLEGSGPYADRDRHPLPSLVLLDLNLPVLSGFEVLKWMRGRPDLTSLPVVVFSSSMLPEDKAKATQLGANEYVEKPPSGIQFGEVVTHLTGRWL